MNESLQLIIEQYLFGVMAEGVVRDAELNLIPNEYFPDIVVMLMNEEPEERLTAGLVGYALGLGLNVEASKVQIPREVSLACLELLRPYATAERPDLTDIVIRCDRANHKYLTGKDIEESGANNVTQLH